jgi:integrase
VRIDETVYELGPLVKGTPKSEAGKRKIAIPELITPTSASAWRTSPRTARTGSSSSASEAASSAGATSPNPGLVLSTRPASRGVHVHDLRHTRNAFAAETDASLAELMSRMGHSSARRRGSTSTLGRSGTRRSPRRWAGWSGGR